MFYDVFLSLCKENGISVSKAAEDIGLNRAAVAKWKKGSVPVGSTLRKFADYFNVTTDYLLTGEQKEKPSADFGEELEFSDMELLAAYKSADEVTRQLIRRALGL